MKKALFKIIIPVCVLVLWMITCYPVCNKADGFDYFLYWILVGCPYGIRKMCMFLVPKNFGIAGSMGILALNCIILLFPLLVQLLRTRGMVSKFAYVILLSSLSFSQDFPVDLRFRHKTKSSQPIRQLSGQLSIVPTECTIEAFRKKKPN